MKARLRTIFLSALGAITAFSAVTLSSCEEDKCKAIVCAYNGVCREGTCFCLDGYEGAQCETITRERYKGTWTVFEKGTLTSPAQYDVTIDYGDNMTQVKIYNFYNKFKEPVYANIKGDTITIPQQTLTIESLGGYTISGKGYLNESLYYGENGELIMRYSIQEPSGKTNDYGINIGEPSIWNR